jgi:hypothetical protein
MKKNKTDPLTLLFANHNKPTDPHVINHKTFKGNIKYKGKLDPIVSAVIEKEFYIDARKVN